jgi:N-methylhydantoinase B
VFERDAASLKPGQWFEIITPGAGGYGPPAQRDPAAVERDLAQGVIDGQTAREAHRYEV